MLRRNLQTLLIGAQAVGFATLIRSVAFDRWITVLAAALLVVGATAGLRGRTWGVALAFMSATAFPVAWAIGIAPLWFVFVGLIGALPFISASGVLAKVDRKATAWLAAIAGSLGAAGAVAWKLVAWDLFAAFPALRPSAFPQHGLAVVALLAAGMAAMLAASRSSRKDGPRVEMAERSEPLRVRIAEPASSRGHEAEAEAAALDEARASHRRRS